MNIVTDLYEKAAGFFGSKIGKEVEDGIEGAGDAIEREIGGKLEHGSVGVIRDGADKLEHASTKLEREGEEKLEQGVGDVFKHYDDKIEGGLSGTSKNSFSETVNDVATDLVINQPRDKYHDEFERNYNSNKFGSKTDNSPLDLNELDSHGDIW